MYSVFFTGYSYVQMTRQVKEDAQDNAQLMLSFCCQVNHVLMYFTLTLHHVNSLSLRFVGNGRKKRPQC